MIKGTQGTVLCVDKKIISFFQKGAVGVKTNRFFVAGKTKLCYINNNHR